MKKSDKILFVIAIVLFVAIVLAVFTEMAIRYELGRWSTPLWIEMSRTVNSNGTSWVIYIVYMNYAVPTRDVYVKILDMDSNVLVYELLSNYPSGIRNNGLTYYDLSNNDILDAGDYFTLDVTEYPAGTRFELMHYRWGIAGFVILG